MSVTKLQAALAELISWVETGVDQPHPILERCHTALAASHAGLAVAHAHPVAWEGEPGPDYQALFNLIAQHCGGPGELVWVYPGGTVTIVTGHDGEDLVAAIQRKQRGE